MSQNLPKELDYRRTTSSAAEIGSSTTFLSSSSYQSWPRSTVIQHLAQAASEAKKEEKPRMERNKFGKRADLVNGTEQENTNTTSSSCTNSTTSVFDVVPSDVDRIYQELSKIIESNPPKDLNPTMGPSSSSRMIVKPKTISHCDCEQLVKSKFNSLEACLQNQERCNNNTIKMNEVAGMLSAKMHKQGQKIEDEAAKIRKEYDVKMARMRAENDVKIAQMKEEYDGKMAKMKEEHEETMTNLTVTLQEEMAKLLVILQTRSESE